MARFAYEAVDLTGQITQGIIRADSAQGARAALEQRRLSPVRVDAAPTAAPAGFSRRLGVGQLSLITRQLATLARVAPLEEALRTIAAQMDGPRVRPALEAVRAGVVEGRRLSDAMALPGEVFPAHYRAMVAAGESAGALPEILERLSDLLEREQQAKSRLLTALIYPAALTVIAVMVVIALMSFVVPKVVDQFESMGQTLPLLTRVIIGVSSALRDWGWLMLIVLAVASLGVNRLLARPGPRLAFDTWLLKVPGLGRLIRDQNAARLARTLSVMIAAGVPLVEGLSLTARTVGNHALRAATEGMAVSIREGGSLSGGLRAAGVFPPILVHMAASGEASGQLQPMLTGAADYLEREMNTFTQVTLSLLEPVIIIVMGAVVALIVLSILLPILQIDTLTLR